jgi:hypothetical protein
MFDSLKPHVMPTSFGPRPVKLGSGLYGDVTTVMLPYLTDARRLARLIDAPFRLNGDPVLQIVFAMNRDVQWLAGRGYNLIASPRHSISWGAPWLWTPAPFRESALWLPRSIGCARETSARWSCVPPVSAAWN